MYLLTSGLILIGHCHPVLFWLAIAILYHFDWPLPSLLFDWSLSCFLIPLAFFLFCYLIGHCLIFFGHCLLLFFDWLFQSNFILIGHCLLLYIDFDLTNLINSSYVIMFLLSFQPQQAYIRVLMYTFGCFKYPIVTAKMNIPNHTKDDKLILGPSKFNIIFPRNRIIGNSPSNDTSNATL